MVYYVKTLSDTDCSYRFRIPTDMYTTFLRPRFNAEQIQIANNGGIFPITALCIDSNNLYNLTCRCSARQNRVTERYFEGQWLLYSAERNLQAGFRLLFGWSVGLFRLKIRVIPDASDPQLGLLSVLRFWDQFHGCFLPRIPRITGANGVNVEHATGVSISVVLRMLEHGDRLELVDPSYRPSLASVGDKGPVALPVAGSDLVISPAQWSSHVVGKISSWIDLDSDDEVLRRDSETILKQELAWASHLSLQACLLPPPKGTSCANYARCVNQILQSSTNNLQLWLRIPLRKHEDGDPIDDEPLGGDPVDSWETWNSFRHLCEHSNQLSIALDVLSSLPSSNSLVRWFGEPVRAAILHSGSFLTNARGYPCLSKRHQKLVTAFFNHSVQVVLSGGKTSFDLSSNNLGNHVDSNKKHPLKLYLDYIGYLYQKMDPLPEQEQYELGYRDFLQSPLQPLMDNLEAQTYETFEKDTVKYTQYQRAVGKALLDRVPDEMASSVTTVLMVVGAGRGPLVRASLEAAEETSRKLKVYAVEKNPNAVITLHSLVKLEGWENIVTIVSCDMRHWDAPEKADILVSELLGSFGDNELSPECLDGAQRFLKPDGISIPSSYTSFLQPITTSKLYNDVRAHNDLAHYETAYVVKFHKVARLAPCQPVFTFNHPDSSLDKDNQRYTKLKFEIPSDTGSALVHGFAGYFDSTLYKDVHLGIEPTMPTPNMFSWFPIYFPLRTPLCIKPGTPLEVHMWRCCDTSKVWYEWCVASPSPSPIHNSKGRSYWVGL